MPDRAANDEVAPILAVRGTLVEPRQSTHSGRSAACSHCRHLPVIFKLPLVHSGDKQSSLLSLAGFLPLGSAIVSLLGGRDNKPHRWDSHRSLRGIIRGRTA